MGGRKKHTIEEVKEFVEKFKYILLAKEYVNHEKKLNMICDRGHNCLISFKCFKNGTRCNICANINRSLKQRTPFVEVKNIIENNQYLVLHGEENYINEHSELTVKCPNEHEFSTSLANLKCAKFKCRKCSNVEISEKKRTDGNIVYYTFIEKGLIPQFQPKDYINTKQKLPFLCPNHIEEGIKLNTFEDVRLNKFLCKSCYLEYNKKENHWNWQGGVSNLNDYLRVRLNEWKFNSLKVYDFKCAISGIHTKDLEIHHLYNFSDIVKETMEILNLPIQKISQYSDKELDLIEVTFNKIHDNYGLGIPLTKEIHTDYHMTFGFDKNTHQQFEEFKQNYINKQKEVKV
jgi:hypothetical protein